MKRLVCWLGRMLTDEKGTPSTARFAFVLTLAVSLYLVTADAHGAVRVAEQAWEFMTFLIGLLVAWAGGNRLAQHILPSLSSILSRRAASRLSPSPGSDLPAEASDVPPAG